MQREAQMYVLYRPYALYVLDISVPKLSMLLFKMCKQIEFWIAIQDLYVLNWWIVFINENLRSWKVEDLLRVTALYLVGDGIQLTVCSLWKYINSHSLYTSSSDKYRLVKHKINET